MLYAFLPWTEHVSNSNVLEKMKTKRKLILNIKKRWLRFLGHIMNYMEGLENLILIAQIECKRDKGRQCITYLMSLSKSMVEQGLGEITNTKFIKSYDTQEVEESHDPLCPEETQHIKKKHVYCIIGSKYG